MPIAALPESTAQAIGSTSVLSDACSVVKELLDNALDANASSVSIEVSQNTVDLIQVKDNGHGIPPEDHGLVCKRSFTSKIQTLEDLRNVGGSSLGFRGEALASACEMSGALSVTTRIESQVVGSTLKYSRTGELVSSERISHPVGTTVRVTDFLKHIPVRRQTALKGALKTITRIKKLLQAYAIARPSKRLSFRVLKSKTESNNWTYGPKQNATLKEAALRVAGPEITAQCILTAWPSQKGDEYEEEHSVPASDETPDYKLVAFLPRADSEEFSKVSNAGQYISIDGRPVSTARGTPNDIAKLFKTYIRSAARNKENPASLSDPFFCLHIHCPEGSYDANIEPAKDDVLFANSATVLSLAEALFKHIYGELDNNTNPDPQPGKRGEIPDSNSFDLLMARKPAAVPLAPAASADNGYSQVAPTRSNAIFTSPAAPSTQRSSINELQEEGMQRNPRIGGPTRSREIDVMNPWAIARFNSPVRSPDNIRQNIGDTPQLLTPIRSQRYLENREPVEMNRQHSRSPMLPSPSNTDSTSNSPSDSRRSPLFLQPSQYPDGPNQTVYTKSSRDRARERYGNGALDTWFQKTTQSSLQQQSANDLTVQGQEELISEQRASERFGRQRQSPQSESEILVGIAGNVNDVENYSESPPDLTDASKPTERRRVPVLDIEDPESSVADGRRHEFPVLERWSSLLHRSSTQESNSELEEALDFERRKKAAIQCRREQTKNRLGSVTSRNEHAPSSSPHHNRYLAARAALASTVSSTTETPNHSTQTEAPTESALDHNDPRAYFIRHQDLTRQDQLSKSGLKIRRVHTSRLPLERIPEGSNLHDIVLTWPVSVEHLSVSFRQARKIDSYSRCGTTFDTFSTDIKNLSEPWEARLSALIKERYRTKEENDEPEIHFDLFSAIKGHMNDLSND